MLTNNLLKYSTKKGSLYPTFVDPQDEEALVLATVLLGIAKESIGTTQGQMEQALIRETELTNVPYGAGFMKLLLDKADYEESEADIEEQRWDLIKRAQDFRTESYFRSKEEFQETFASEYGKGHIELSKTLYADLPEYRPLQKVSIGSPIDLIYRYNCSLVQSMLLMNPRMEVRVHCSTTPEKRKIIRAIKFHRLVVGDLRLENEDLCFTVDGPLSILVNTTAYGMRMANFFPRLILSKKWDVSALVQIKKNRYQLHLNQNDPLKSHYKEWGDYQPEEFREFLKHYTETSSSWQVRWCEDLLRLNGRDLCFPDMTFTHEKTGQKVYLELFHRWHRGQLEKRLANISEMNGLDIIIGVCASLSNQVSMGYELKQVSNFSFNFRGVPTPKAVNPLLDRLEKI